MIEPGFREALPKEWGETQINDSIVNPGEAE